jgi:hypothetical protein
VFSVEEACYAGFASLHAGYPGFSKPGVTHSRRAPWKNATGPTGRRAVKTPIL